MYYKELPDGTRLVEYKDLSDNAKKIARYEVLIADIKGYVNDREAYIVLIKNNIHSCVNSRAIYKALINRKEHINRTMSDIDYCEMYIVGNLCQFTINGNYITYYNNNIKLTDEEMKGILIKNFHWLDKY